MEGSKTKAKVICNPASGGGDYDPDEVKKELGEFDIEWISTEKPGDAEEADEPVEFEVVPGALRVVAGEGYVAEPER